MSDNPLLSKLKKVFPGLTCRLPSEGLLYDSSVLDPEVTNGEVLVYSMTTQDEIIMRTPDMLFQGTAITTVFKRCIPQILDPSKLYIHDVDFLLGVLRKVSYGDFLPIRHTCPACRKRIEDSNKRLRDEETHEKVKEHEYNIPLNRILMQVKTLDSKFIENMKFNLHDFIIQIKPITHEEFVKFQVDGTQIRDDSSADDIMKALVENTSKAIKSIDNVSDPELIAQWLHALPRNDMETLCMKINEMNNWGVEYKWKINCKDCNKEHEIGTVLNPTYFFTLPSSQETSKL